MPSIDSVEKIQALNALGIYTIRLQNMGLSGKVRCFVDSDSRHDGFPRMGGVYQRPALVFVCAMHNVYGPLGLYGPTLVDGGLLDDILASVGESVFFVIPTYHKLEIG